MEDNIALSPAMTPTARTPSGELQIQQNLCDDLTRSANGHCVRAGSKLPSAIRIFLVVVCGLSFIALFATLLLLHFSFVHACQYQHGDDLMSAILGSQQQVPTDLVLKNQTNLPIAIGVIIGSGKDLTTKVRQIDATDLLATCAAQNFVVSRDISAVAGKAAGPVLWVDAVVGTRSSVWRGWMSSVFLEEMLGYQKAVLNSVDCLAEQHEVTIYLASNSPQTTSVTAYSAAVGESPAHKVFNALLTMVVGWLTLVVLSAAIQLQLWILMGYAVPAVLFCFAQACQCWAPSLATRLIDLYGQSWYTPAFWVVTVPLVPLALGCVPSLTCTALLAWYSNLDDIWAAFTFMAIAETVQLFLCRSSASKQLLANTAPIVLLTYMIYMHTFYYNGFGSLAAAVTLCALLLLGLVVCWHVEAPQGEFRENSVCGPMVYDLDSGPPSFWLVLYSWYPSWYLYNNQEDGWHVQGRNHAS